jgi:hypothetical protein
MIEPAVKAVNLLWLETYAEQMEREMQERAAGVK